LAGALLLNAQAASAQKGRNARFLTLCSIPVPGGYVADLVRLALQDPEDRVPSRMDIPPRANGLVFLIFLGATGFSYVFRVLGGDDLMISTLTHFGIDTKWETLAFVMVLIFLLGFPFEWIEICLIVLPVFGRAVGGNAFTSSMSVQRCPKTGSGKRPPGENDLGSEKPPFKRSLKIFCHSGRPSDNRGLERRIGSTS
jgi:hypothetical protein